MYLISYDIENDKIRNKIAKELENHGRKVQYSVFECEITPDRFHKLYEKMANLMEDEESGNIRFYHLCKNCVANTITMGIDSDHSEDEDLIII